MNTVPLRIADRSIARVYIVDDDPTVRSAYELPLEELALQPIQAVGPLQSLAEFTVTTRVQSDAAICDHQLRIKNYATFNGAELVASYYRSHFPAILCTRWGEEAGIDDIRRFRRFIPVLLKPAELSPDTIIHGFGKCLDEFADRFLPERRAWRTLVRVEDVSEDTTTRFAYVVLPGWQNSDVIRLPLAHLPGHVRDKVAPGKRFHARVNLGAEQHGELFFDAWESE